MPLMAATGVIDYPRIGNGGSGACCRCACAAAVFVSIGDPAEMADLSEEEMRRLQVLSNFSEKAGFSAIQSTRPQTLAYALTDSPVGQLAWNELLMGMGESNLLTQDQILTQVMMYWLTGTAGSSARQYYEDAHPGTA